LTLPPQAENKISQHISRSSVRVRCRQGCRFQRFVSYLSVTCDSCSERNYTGSSISKYKF